MNSSNSRPESFKAAFFKSPGPRDAGEAMLLFGKGVCMGSADIVPGVSGGTIALITGIYGQLLEAIGSINAVAVKDLLRGNLLAFVSTIHLRFLLVLLSGIGIALISLARLMYFLLEQHPVPTWGFFLGLIAASLLVLGRDIKGWGGSGGLFFLLGTASAYFLVALIPVSTPETTWFIFLSGAIAICAMILPGISGSFLLLILGKYHFVTGALRNPLIPENIFILVVFGAGCVIGILSFSKFLNFLMHRYHNLTMSLLTGLICGSMRKIWPWKEVLEKVVIRGKTYVLKDQNILPPSLDGEFWLTCMLVLLGFSLVLLLQHVSKRHHPSG